LIITDVVAQPIKSIADSIEPAKSVYSLRLNPPDARSLGLREGQVVNGVIENRPDGNVLLLGKNVLIKLPNIVPTAARLDVQVRLDSLASGFLSILFGRKAASNSAILNIQESRLARLIAGTNSFQGLRELLNLTPKSGLANERLSNLPNFSLATDWFKNFDFRAIERSMLHSGLFHEQMVRDGKPQQNLKELLLRILSGVRLERVEMFSVLAALEDLESSQIESLAAQLNRNTHYHWLIPVSGEWPIDIQLFGGEPEAGEEEPSQEDYAWKVVIKIKVTETEIIELSTVFDTRNVVNFYLAMPNDQLLAEANVHRGWLLSELQKIGIELGELKIFRKGSEEVSTQYDLSNQSGMAKRLLGDA